MTYLLVAALAYLVGRYRSRQRDLEEDVAYIRNQIDRLTLKPVREMLRKEKDMPIIRRPTAQEIEKRNSPSREEEIEMEKLIGETL